MDKFILQEEEPSYSGDLSFSIPVLTVPGRHGHDFEVRLTYNSNITQRQFASWVGLGWSLEPGCIERTVHGRTDEPVPISADPNHNLGMNDGGIYRGNLGGRFDSTGYLSQETINKDVADLYQLSIDGGGMEIMPCNYQIHSGQITSMTGWSSYMFIPVRYRPWAITATVNNGANSDGSICSFAVDKEDGTRYTYGYVQNGYNADYVKVKGNPSYSPAYPSFQEYEFPYRWNLSTIRYPDGSATEITYRVGPNQDHCYRRYESVMIDRSQLEFSGVGNFFGNIPPPFGLGTSVRTMATQTDYALYSYSHPDILNTDTHYAVFRTSMPSADSTARNCRLDTLILFERGTNKELKRIVFHYAANNNSGPVWIAGGSQGENGTTAWNSENGAERLNNGQLTLIGITVTHSNFPASEFNSASTQRYYFTYTTNAQIDLESISTAQYTDPPAEEWPGYFTSAALATAWRIKTVTLPTGGKYTYTYRTENVQYDPEGYLNTTDYWSYNGQPRCVLESKSFDDRAGGAVRTWTYLYSPEVVYDLPSTAYVGEYAPKVFQAGWVFRRDQYYKWYRGCQVGHRWVRVTKPDLSWKTYYYTSSYSGSDVSNPPSQTIPFEEALQSTLLPGTPPGSWDDTSESQADFIRHYSDPSQVLPGATILISRAPCRGLVWKEESGKGGEPASETVRYYYSFLQEGVLQDRYDYFGTVQNNNNSRSCFIVRTSIWNRLDSVTTTRDGVVAATSYQYNSTPRSAYIGDFGNGLISSKTEKGSNSDRRTQYVYAFTKYPDMGSDDGVWIGPMLSQVYSTTLTNVTTNNDVYKEFTTWNLFSGHWLESEKYVWNGLPSDIMAPVDHTGNVIRQRAFAYDNLGYSNIVSETDANNNVRFYYYSSSTSNPFANDALGLSRGYVTGVQDPSPSSVLRRSFEYDPYGNVTRETDENGNHTEAQYDNLGRIKSVIDPLGRLVREIDYYMPPAASSVDLSSIAETAYRSSSDYSITKSFFDGAGYEREKLTVYADSDLISPTTYDGMWRVSRTYKTYKVSGRGAYDHLFDQNFDANDAAYYGYGYTYTQNDYYIDGTERLKDVRPPGSTYQTNHYIHYAYGTNSDADNTGYPSGTLYKTTVYDENNDYANPSAYKFTKLEFKDKFGDLVRSVTDSAGLALTTRYDYEVDGNLVQTIPPNGPNYATTYIYNKAGRLAQKTSPDAGTVRYLYDKNGNLRLVQDVNHAGAMNAISIQSTATGSTITNASLPAMTLPGRITLDLTVISGSGTPSLSVNANGVPVAQITTSSSSSNSFILPKGSYTYSVSPNGTAVQYSITCTDGFEFVYNKYDPLNRLTETGEYQSVATGNFTQENAYSADFPANGIIPNRTFSYDSPGSDACAAGQRNLLGRLSYSVSYRLGSVALTTFYSYDESGRVEWVVQKELGKKILYDYDLQGNVTKKSYQDLNNSANNYYTWYEYDSVGRLANVYSGSDLSSRVKEATYTYSASGKVSRLRLGNSQGIDYTYNSRDWLNSINNQNLTGESQLPSDKFGEVIGYDNVGHVGQLGTSPQYNGNISWLMYRMSDVNYEGQAGTTSLVGYVYSYDNASRLTGANFGYYVNPIWNSTASFAENGITYDGNGNIAGLTRYASRTDILQQLLTLTSRPTGVTQNFGAIAIVASTLYAVPAGSSDKFEASSRITLQSGFRAGAGSTFRASISSTPQGSRSGPMDQLTYHYQESTDRLTYVTDAVASDSYPSDLDNQQVNNYSYDGNGNMLQDLARGISFVVYDINNLPVTVYKT
ncbi:MAG: RHS repeat protein, partial [Bacteroidetes bacterium]|nr:RHS repeat protein [Bacteroidota bacterium]